MWVLLDFTKEGFHNTSPGDFEDTFIKAGYSVTKEGLRAEKVIRKGVGGLLWLPRKL